MSRASPSVIRRAIGGTINRNGRLDPVEDELPDIFEGFSNRNQVGDLAALYQSERAERQVVGLLVAGND